MLQQWAELQLAFLMAWCAVTTHTPATILRDDGLLGVTCSRCGKDLE